MVRNGEISMSEVKRVFRAHWWITPSITLLATALAFIATMVVPKKYTSTTSVLVEQPIIPRDFVKPVVDQDLNQRLASMKTELLSTSYLEPIIDKFDLYPDRQGKVPKEQLVADLQKAVDIDLLQPTGGSLNGKPPGFRVSVTFENPVTAQRICKEIADLFLKENKAVRILSGETTTDFLSSQLEEAKAKMDEQDAKLADFKRRYLGSLPEEEPTNLSLLGNLQTQLEANTQNIGRAEQDRSYNETMLAQQEATWKLIKDGNGANPDNQEQQLAALQDQLTNMLAHYTPDYPDVIKLKGQIEDLKKRMAQESDPSAAPVKPSGRPAHEPVQIQQLRAKIKQDEATIATLSAQQAKIQAQIGQIQGRLQSSPMVEEQFKELTRNYKAASDFYDDLSRKHSTAAMATDLEHQQQSETFSQLDAPNLPHSPSSPKVPVFLGGGFAAGLFLSLAILYIIALLDKAMYSERDVEKALKLPVLTSVPSLDSAAAHRTGKGNLEPALALKS
jgi:polysaccharide chain length determinant protein (PEP-CTERM system associated)